MSGFESPTRDFQVGTKVYVRAHIIMNGIASIPRSFNAIVPAPYAAVPATPRERSPGALGLS
ncbi:MAG: hypothetical protein LAQ69_52095, partial [Acidobacteriia bacterium]|nr:hypothetical protein [Terriglobia bacterium]